MKKKFVLFLLLSISILASCHSKPLPTVRPSQKVTISQADSFWNLQGNGIETAAMPLPEGENGEKLYFVKLSSKLYSVKIYYFERGTSAKEAVEQTDAQAVINGSYFSPYEQPLGFLKLDGKVINKEILEQIIYSGVVTIKDGRAEICHRTDFVPESCESAMQVGPRLIVSGQVPDGLEQTIDYREKALRSGFAIDSDGNYLIFKTHTAIANWKQLTIALRDPNLKIKDAINLDGGSSSQLYLKNDAGFELNDGAVVNVPIFLGFVKSASLSR